MAIVLLEKKRFELTLRRLAAELLENHGLFKNTVLIGLQPRGIYLASRLQSLLQSMGGIAHVPTGRLDITFYRDDFRRREGPILPSALDIKFDLEEKDVILIDDVLFTGRTVRSGLEAMLAFGRPSKVELLTLIDRRFSRQLPLEANYVGVEVDTRSDERVRVEWKEINGHDKVSLLTKSESEKK